MIFRTESRKKKRGIDVFREMVRSKAFAKSFLSRVGTSSGDCTTLARMPLRVIWMDICDS